MPSEIDVIARVETLVDDRRINIGKRREGPSSEQIAKEEDVVDTGLRMRSKQQLLQKY